MRIFPALRIGHLVISTFQIYIYIYLLNLLSPLVLMPLFICIWVQGIRYECYFCKKKRSNSAIKVTYRSNSSNFPSTDAYIWGLTPMPSNIERLFLISEDIFDLYLISNL